MVGRSVYEVYEEGPEIQENLRRALAGESFNVAAEVDGVAGRGLGLEGVRERVRLWHGRAVIENSPGKGARVFVDLPLAEPPKEAG